jgi:hypothetical protein
MNGSIIKKIFIIISDGDKSQPIGMKFKKYMLYAIGEIILIVLEF